MAQEEDIARDKERGQALVGKLAGYPGPAWRRAYLDGLLRSGLDFLENGNRRTAAYCLDKVEAALAAAEAAPAPAAPTAAAPSSPAKALEEVRARWREDRVKQVESVLEKHGSQLSSLERKAYRDSLIKWTSPEAKARAARVAAPGALVGSAAEALFSETRLDYALQDLRKRLYGRILKTQKAVLARRRGGRPALARIHEQHSGPIGPYNDRQNLEGVLTLLAEADPAWVDEFLELYHGLASLRGLLPQAQ